MDEAEHSERTSLNAALTNLEPRIVWAHFATLCAIPRASLKEAALRDHLIAWAHDHGIEAMVDPVGNLILRKPASSSFKSLSGVIMQAHLDMVCQANAGTRHDFEHDPIRTVIRDGWVVAEHTTLGADNGIGVALALAALEATHLVHPPIEVLLTVNEESGMDGARGLAPGTLQGRNLINLDTEEWGHFYLGCAGGVDVEVRQSYPLTPLAPDHVCWRLDVTGLVGGHSGIDIHRGRGNAIQLLAEVLRDLSSHSSLDLIQFAGGSARNAIPREASALISLPAGTSDWLDKWVEERVADWHQRFANVEPRIHLACKRSETTGKPIRKADRDQLLSFLARAVNGVTSMSRDFPGVVETSANLGVATLSQGAFRSTLKVRSLVDTEADALADTLVTQAESCELNAGKAGAYPGWTLNPESELLALCQRVHTDQFGRPATPQVIHAGLECGLLAASHPHLDMISFGPDIAGAHAPGERVDIASVARCWQLLTGLLQALAA